MLALTPANHLIATYTDGSTQDVGSTTAQADIAQAAAILAQGYALATGAARLFPSQVVAASAVASANPPYPNNTPILVVNATAGLDFFYTSGTSLMPSGASLAGNTPSGRLAFIAACVADGLFSSLIGAASS